MPGDIEHKQETSFLPSAACLPPEYTCTDYQEFPYSNIHTNKKHIPAYTQIRNNMPEDIVHNQETTFLPSTA